MVTPTSVDQTVQRDQPPPPPPADQADLPGSPHTKDLAEEANNNKVAQDFAPASGSDTPEVTAEISALSLSLPYLSPSSSSSSSSSTSPHTSSTEDSPQEASSSSSDYESDSSDDELVTSQRAEARTKSVTEEEHKVQRVAATNSWQYLQRPIDTCLGAGWSPGDALPNRSFANKHIAVARSALQGYGVFAAADIKAGTDVLAEAPLLRARSLEKLCAKHARLGGEEKAVYDGLVGYHEWETCPVRQKWSANSFDLTRGYNAVFAIASNFNHACGSQRNTKYEWDERQQAMTFTAIRDIEKGAEMLVSYCDYRHVLKAVYGFVCHCGACEHEEVDLFSDTRC